MLLKSVSLAFLIGLVHFNQLAFCEDEKNPMGQKPICSKAIRKYTYSQINILCVESNIESSWSMKDKCIEEKKAEVKTVFDCCKGYRKLNETWCEADCKENCKHGDCDDANRCSCAIGFGGVWCDAICPAGHFGLSCEHNCDW